MDLNYLKVEKKGSQLFRSRKIVSQEFGEVKIGFLQFGAPKM